MHKDKAARARYMCEYRRRIKEAASLEGKDLEAKLQEYREQGLDKNALFMDTVYNLAMQGKNAKYAELWWRMTRPEPEQPKAFEPTAADYMRITRNVIEKLREQRKEYEGRCPVCGNVNLS